MPRPRGRAAQGEQGCSQPWGAQGQAPPSLLLPAGACCWQSPREPVHRRSRRAWERRRAPPPVPESVCRGAFPRAPLCRVGVRLTSPPLPVQRETRRPGSSRLLSCQERTLLLRHHRHVLSVQRAVARLRQELLATAQLLQVGTRPGLEAPLWAGGACRQGLCRMCKSLVKTSGEDRNPGGTDGGQVGRLLTGGPKEVSWARWPWPGPGGGAKPLWSWERT